MYPVPAQRKYVKQVHPAHLQAVHLLVALQVLLQAALQAVERAHQAVLLASILITISQHLATLKLVQEQMDKIIVVQSQAVPQVHLLQALHQVLLHLALLLHLLSLQILQMVAM